MSANRQLCPIDDLDRFPVREEYDELREIARSLLHVVRPTHIEDSDERASDQDRHPGS
jgi:hypothetical protein